MASDSQKNIKELAKLIRYDILSLTTEAGSGHPTSSLSAVELMTVLFFGGIFKFDFKNPSYINNDRIIFSKGHASPLFYALYASAGAIKKEELLTFRKFTSRLEGHPTMNFPFTEAATGSLGQGLSIGVGMAINAKYLDKLTYKTYVLMGDSEMAEGSIFEAMATASHYKLDNLIAIADINRLGQRGETLHGHDVKAYAKKASSFGWNAIIVDGHNINEILNAYKKASSTKKVPTIIIAKTFKGAGVSFLKDADNWHGKTLKKEELEKAIAEIGTTNHKLIGKVAKPKKVTLKKKASKQTELVKYDKNDSIATRKAYGSALSRIYAKFPEIVVLDAETSNSTFSDMFKKVAPERFFEMFIAEQNMVGVAQGLSNREKIPFVSTFSAFLSRAYDQIRMGQYSITNVKYVGSHAGVSIGEDGSSQMGLEDIALFRNLLDGIVLYPSDAVSTEKLVEEAAKIKGNVYLRTTRNATPILYKNSEIFPIGGSKTLHFSQLDQITIVAAGITLHEALKAYEILKEKNIHIRIIDLYSIKPIDIKTLKKAAKETRAIITVEDHHIEGGIGEAVAQALSQTEVKIYMMAVEKMPRSGKTDELLDYENISSSAIIRKVKEII